MIVCEFETFFKLVDLCTTEVSLGTLLYSIQCLHSHTGRLVFLVVADHHPRTGKILQICTGKFKLNCITVGFHAVRFGAYKIPFSLHSLSLKCIRF